MKTTAFITQSDNEQYGYAFVVGYNVNTFFMRLKLFVQQFTWAWHDFTLIQGDPLGVMVYNYVGEVKNATRYIRLRQFSWKISYFFICLRSRFYDGRVIYNLIFERLSKMLGEISYFKAHQLLWCQLHCWPIKIKRTDIQTNKRKHTEVQWHRCCCCCFSGRQNNLSKAYTRVPQATFQMIN